MNTRCFFLNSIFLVRLLRLLLIDGEGDEVLLLLLERVGGQLDGLHVPAVAQLEGERRVGAVAGRGGGGLARQTTKAAVDLRKDNVTRRPPRCRTRTFWAPLKRYSQPWPHLACPDAAAGPRLCRPWWRGGSGGWTACSTRPRRTAWPRRCSPTACGRRPRRRRVCAGRSSAGRARRWQTGASRNCTASGSDAAGALQETHSQLTGGRSEEAKWARLRCVPGICTQRSQLLSA